MYAVIRTGGKQYRVAPGDIIRVEKVSGDPVEFEVLAASPSEGEIARPQQGRAIGQVVGEGRGDKVLVFHYKRKKQYKKLFGHRQPFTAVRITEIAFDGQKFTAPAPASATARGPKAAEGGAAPEAAVAPKKKKKTAKKAESGAAPGAGSKTAAAHSGPTKVTGSKAKGGKPPAPRKKK